jgi:nicotinate phosphoribosyltransferase
MNQFQTVILPSILDNDFYKFTMQHAVMNLFPKAKAKYHFINRGNHRFPPGFAEALRASVEAMEELQLTKQEKKFLTITCPYLNPVYFDFLEGYRYKPDEVNIEQIGEELYVSIEGDWYRNI